MRLHGSWYSWAPWNLAPWSGLTMLLVGVFYGWLVATTGSLRGRVPVVDVLPALVTIAAVEAASRWWRHRRRRENP